MRSKKPAVLINYLRHLRRSRSFVVSLFMRCSCLVCLKIQEACRVFVAFSRHDFHDLGGVCVVEKNESFLIVRARGKF